MNKQQLKQLFKFFKKHEESASLTLGLVMVLGLLGLIGWYSQRTPRATTPRLRIDEPVEVQRPQVSLPPLPTSPTPVSNTRILDGARVYTVQAGEGLWQIAEKFYGDGNKNVLIFDANRDVMASPEDVRVGMELRIP